MDHFKQLHVWLSKKENKMLDKFQKEWGVTRTAAVRRIIQIAEEVEFPKKKKTTRKAA